tara:strand:- start:647 stop:1150 length:504 start_codon:yes stop_codon:yes gene_type:complete
MKLVSGKIRYKAVIRKFLMDTGKRLDRELKATLIRQGHYDTGDFERSIKFRRLNNRDSISFFAHKLAFLLDSGRKQGWSPPLKPLVKWVERKLGHKGRAAWAVATAIQKKIRAEGYPTGKLKQMRMFFIERTLKRTSQQTEKELHNALSRQINRVCKDLTKDKIIIG